MPAYKTFREKSVRTDIGVGIDIVAGCNLKCVQCYNTKTKPAQRYLPFDQYKEIVRLAAEKFGELYLLGGEPTQHPLLIEFVEFGLKHMDSVMVVTNGLRLANESYCQKLALPRLDLSMHRRAVSISAQALVDELSGRPGTFVRSQKAWENVEKHWQGHVCVQVNLLRPLVSSGHVFEVFKWARQKGYEPVIEMVKSSDNFRRGDKLDPTSAEVQAIFEAMHEYDLTHYPNQRPTVVVPPVYGHACTLMETSLHITIGGDIVLCVGNDTISYGNVFNGGIDQALSSPIRAAIQDYRTWIVGPCRDCTNFEDCHGGCRGNAKAETGCPRASDPYCWRHLPKATLRDMAPSSCSGCILENHPGCNLLNL